MKTSSKNEISSTTKWRITLVYLIMVLFGIACLAKILYLSIVERTLALGTSPKCIDTTVPGYKKDTNDTRTCFVKMNMLRPVRGEIYDDHGRVLVANYTVFEVSFDGSGFAKEYKDTLKSNPKAFDEILQQLADDFYYQFKDRFPKYNAAYYYQFLTTNIAEKTYKCLFPVKDWDERSWVTSVDTSYIKNRPYLYYSQYDNKKEDTVRKKLHTHFNFVSTSVRINPYGEMAKRTLGVESHDRKYGLEHTMNDILGGEQGSKKYLEINKAMVPLRDRLDPVDGYNIHTTIKLEIQHAVHNELSRKLSELNAEWGCAIVMETKTGEIKAISNLRRAASDGSYYNESMEYALNAKVEPGSTFKIASLLAYLEKVGNDTACIYPMFNHTFKYPLKNGSFKSFPKSDSKVHGETLGTPSEIIQRSSNIGIASMIFRAYGIKNFHNYRNQLKKMGMFDTIHTQLGDILPAKIKDGTNDFNTYYATCFGAGFTIPILRTLTYYNAIANDGKMMAPLFVRYITDTYDTIQTYEPIVLKEHFVSDSTVKWAKQYLEKVVWGPYGTARRYRDKNCMFAGKTGTRDIWDEQARAYRTDINAVSFCGYFPMDKPQYTVIIYIYGVPYHSDVAVDAFARIARSIMNSTNYSATRSTADFPLTPLGKTGPIQQKYFNTLLSGLGYDTVAYEANIPYMRVETTDTNRHVSSKTLPLNTYQKMPDVRGMVASDAVTELIRAGYNPRIIGHGRVKSQVLDNSSGIVKLYLE